MSTSTCSMKRGFSASRPLDARLNGVVPHPHVEVASTESFKCRCHYVLVLRYPTRSYLVGLAAQPAQRNTSHPCPDGFIFLYVASSKTHHSLDRYLGCCYSFGRNLHLVRM